jgi:CDP-diacylglycerol---glycerol-3-phosphate 3-phosphatidyltransferase
MPTSMYSARDMVSVPGLLSLARAPLGAAFVATSGRPRVALTMLALSGASDVLDGWSARRLRRATPTGALLDAVMDKLFVGVVASGLVARHALTGLDLVLLGTREIGELVLAGRLAMDESGLFGRRRAPHLFGKATTVLQYGAIAASVLRSSLRRPLVVATAAVGLAAAIVYAARDLRYRSAGGWGSGSGIGSPE